MGLLDDIFKAIEKPAQPAGKWVNGKFVKSPYKSAIPSQPTQLPYSFKFNVVGINYRIDDVMKLATPMKKWFMSNDQIAQKYGTKPIYRYYFTNEPIQLIPDPNNPHDSNAIMVLINNIHVGYVPKENCILVKSMLNSNQYNISAKFSGGEYKIIFPDGVVSNIEPISLTIYISKE